MSTPIVQCVMSRAVLHIQQLKSKYSVYSMNNVTVKNIEYNEKLCNVHT